jgi:hypothetical protein
MREVYQDRRRWGRVPFSGTMRWQAACAEGHCEVLDLSPDGAAMRVPRTDPQYAAGNLTFDIDVLPGVTWRVTDSGRIVRIIPDDADTWRVCVAFPDDPGADRAAPTGENEAF